MLYVRLPLSLRDVEDLLHGRRIEISHETVRFWWYRFGPLFAAEIRGKRVEAMRAPRHWRWHPAAVCVKINGLPLLQGCREIIATGSARVPPRMSELKPAPYGTRTWSSQAASPRKRRSLLNWLDKDMAWRVPPNGSPGRTAVFLETAIQACLTTWGRFKLPLLQLTGKVASLPRLANPDFALDPALPDQGEARCPQAFVVLSLARF